MAASSFVVPFLYELREFGLRVSATEIINLAKAMEAGLHDSSLDGFYYLGRSLLVHREADYDAFDAAFAKHFRNADVDSAKFKKELFDWLEDAKQRRDLSEEEQALLEAFDKETLERMFEERLQEQKERHDGGNKWIGTGGTSPFGHSGAAREGIRVGGKGGNRSAIHVAEQRAWRGYRDDLILDTRQMSVALRKLKNFSRDGANLELDIEGTIDETAKNAGELEVKLRPERRSNVRVILLMDVGGSMDPYAQLVSRLFSAANKASHFRELRTYYFHNCVYGRVYKDSSFTDAVSLSELFAECGPNYKLIVVGDALMAPYELMSAGGSLFWGENNRVEGIVWLMRLQQHFQKSCWLNPEPKQYWSGNTIEAVASVFDMYPLSGQGLSEAVQHLMRGAAQARAR